MNFIGKFVYRMAVIEIVPTDDTRRLELRKHQT